MTKPKPRAPGSSHWPPPLVLPEITTERLATMSRPELLEWLSLMDEFERRDARRLFYKLYPAETDTARLDDRGRPRFYARDLYPKHMEFFEVGATYRERCLMAANRVGKTFGGGGYETTCHLTGLYPDWWRGRRFSSAVNWWAAGKTGETTRDIVQKTLLGDVMAVDGRKFVSGTGLIPGDLLGPTVTWKAGNVPDLVDTCRVKHVPTGKWSTLGLKSYHQGRGSFEGTAQHGVWCDEEPPADVYGEILIRTATTDGIVLLTFTPLEGHSEVVMQFLPTEDRPAA